MLKVLLDFSKVNCLFGSAFPHTVSVGAAITHVTGTVVLGGVP